VTEDRVLIVGGGVSGLATAYFLAKQGIRSAVVEKSARLGGLIRTDLIQGCQVEAGPDSYVATKPAVTELAEELGDLKNEIIGTADESRRIYVVRRGKLVPMPEGMVMMVPGLWKPVMRSRLFSLRTKARLVAESFSAPRKRSSDVSVEELIGDHFGKEVVDYAAEPLLSGVYGGAPENLSAESVLPRFVQYERDYGSLIRGAHRERSEKPPGRSLFLSFQGGMQTLTDSLVRATEDSMDVVHGEAIRVERAEGSWRVKVGGDWAQSNHLVLACPAHVSSRLLKGTDPVLASKLAEIPYSSAILVTQAYDRSKVRNSLDGFGFLVPRVERRRIAAATWVSTKFPSRAPKGIALLRAFIVGTDAEQLLDADQEELAHFVQNEFKRLMGIDEPSLFHAVQVWPGSMPQYVVGHVQRCGEIAQMIDARQGLYLLGNAYDGVGVPDCVRLAKETAKRITTARNVMRTI
jgi:oxygen-dependent protoporphyrinogen oxidase